MTTVRQFEGLGQVSLPGRPLHLAIGMFDGVHLGHRAVIDAAIQSARREGALAGVLTFWPHPSVMVRPDNPVRMITDKELRGRLLSETGVDFVVTQPFTPEFAAIDAGTFIPYLQRYLSRLRTIYVGENWRFGKGRTGDVSALIALAKQQGLSVVSAERIRHNGEPISSTRIRSCLEHGEMEEANELLGYTYFTEGPVIRGRQLGRTIGFPTLNLAWNPELPPRFGVYSGTLVRTGAAPQLAVMNYGVRPTVETGTPEPRLEVHVIGECDVAPGEHVRAEWRSFIRPEQRFADLNALKAQIEKDRAQVIAENR